MDKQTQTLGPTVWIVTHYQYPEGDDMLGVFATEAGALAKASERVAFEGGDWKRAASTINRDGLGFRGWTRGRYEGVFATEVRVQGLEDLDADRNPG